MKLFELLEKRSHPGKNIGKQGHQAAVAMLSKIPNLDEYGVTMTDKAKVGVYPQSKHSTPIGVYFYPAEYYLDTKQNFRTLDYQDEARYIQIFKITGNILYINEVSNGEYLSVNKELINLVPTLSKLYNKSGNELYTHLVTLAKQSSSEALVGSYGGRLWYVLYALSNYLAESKTNKISKKPKDEDDAFAIDNTPSRITADKNTIIWNKLLRLLGYSAVIDLGAGIIHENEPSQGVVVDSASIQLVSTFQQKFDKETDDENNDGPLKGLSFYVYTHRTPSLNWLKRAYNYIISYGEHTVTSKKIANYAINVLDRHPQLLLQFTLDTLRIFATASGDDRNYNKLELGRLLAEWSHGGYEDMVNNMLASQNVNVDETDIKTLKKFRGIIKKYSTDKRAAEILTRIDKMFTTNN